MRNALLVSSKENGSDLLFQQVVEGETIWAEMAYYGTQTDGKKHVTRGVSISGIQGEQIAWARLYIETEQEPQ